MRRLRVTPNAPRLCFVSCVQIHSRSIFPQDAERIAKEKRSFVGGAMKFFLRDDDCSPSDVRGVTDDYVPSRSRSSGFEPSWAVTFLILLLITDFIRNNRADGEIAF
jgi:hypothetical protein